MTYALPMRLWLFTFTQPDRTLASARVAAQTREEAAAFMGNALGRPLLGTPYTHPEPGTILACLGLIDRGAGLVSIVTNDGQVREVA